MDAVEDPVCLLQSPCISRETLLPHLDGAYWLVQVVFPEQQALILRALWGPEDRPFTLMVQKCLIPQWD